MNPRTVSQAYAALERDGVVQVRHGKGTFVAPGVRPEEKERPRLATGGGEAGSGRRLAERARAGRSDDGAAGSGRWRSFTETEARRRTMTNDDHDGGASHRPREVAHSR